MADPVFESPTFLAHGSPDGMVTFHFPAQLTAWVRHLAGETGCELEITISERGKDRTRAQEKAFHAALTPWAYHKGMSVDELKQVVLARAFGTLHYVDKTTGLQYEILKEPRSSKLNRRKYMHLFDTLIEMAATDEPPFYILPPDEYLALKAAQVSR